MFKNVNPWWGLFVVFAFASVICFFQINSAFADAHKLNGVAKVLGVLFAVVSIAGLYKASKTFTGKGG